MGKRDEYRDITGIRDEFHSKEKYRGKDRLTGEMIFLTDEEWDRYIIDLDKEDEPDWTPNC